MSYSTKASYSSGSSYGSSNIRGYNYNRLAIKSNYSANRLTGYSLNTASNPTYASFLRGQQIYEEFMKKQPKYERQEMYGAGEALNKNIPVIRVTAPSFSSLSSFLSSALGSKGVSSGSKSSK